MGLLSVRCGLHHSLQGMSIVNEYSCFTQANHALGGKRAHLKPKSEGRVVGQQRFDHSKPIDCNQGN